MLPHLTHQSTEAVFPERVGSDEFEKCLKEQGLGGAPRGIVAFDLRKVEFAPLEVLMSMLCLFNRLACDKAEVVLRWESSQASFGYAERMGFFGALHTDVSVIPERPADTSEVHRGRNGKLLEVTTLPLGRADLGNAALQLLTARLEENLGHGKAVAVNRIWTCASETVSNLYEHSKSPVPGLLAVQRYSSSTRGDRLQLVIADAGLGLAATIREGNPAAAGSKSDIDLILKAFRDGLSSKLEPGRGCGLSQCAHLAALYAGNLRVRTGATWAKLVTKSTKGWTVGIYDDTAVFLAGTQIVFDFYLDRVSHETNLIH